MAARARAGDLAAEDREKVESHPLRVLDSKRPRPRRWWPAPRMADLLDDASAPTSSGSRTGLASLGIPFEVEPGLVRGLDYYTHTLFEFQSEALDTAQSTSSGAGATTAWSSSWAVRPPPASGSGPGSSGCCWPATPRACSRRRRPALDVFVVDATDGGRPATSPPSCGPPALRTDRAFDGRSMKAQMKAAGRSGAWR